MWSQILKFFHDDRSVMTEVNQYIFKSLRGVKFPYNQSWEWNHLPKDLRAFEKLRIVKIKT